MANDGSRRWKRGGSAGRTVGIAVAAMEQRAGAVFDWRCAVQSQSFHQQAGDRHPATLPLSGCPAAQHTVT